MVLKFQPCKYCKKYIAWKIPYTQGDRPVDKNGDEHDCSEAPWNKNGKLRRFKNKYSYDPFGGDSNKERKYYEKLQNAKYKCWVCEQYFRILEPCDHSLPSGDKFKKRRDEYLKKIKGSV